MNNESETKADRVIRGIIESGVHYKAQATRKWMDVEVMSTSGGMQPFTHNCGPVGSAIPPATFIAA